MAIQVFWSGFSFKKTRLIIAEIIGAKATITNVFATFVFSIETTKTILVIANETIKARLRPDKIFCAPQGLNNGKNGKVGVVKHNKKVLTKFPIFDFKPSDIIDLKLPGGGGHGDPLKRSRKLIDDDFKKGYCTKKYITKNYK